MSRNSNRGQIVRCVFCGQKFKGLQTPEEKLLHAIMGSACSNPKCQEKMQILQRFCILCHKIKHDVKAKCGKRMHIEPHHPRYYGASLLCNGQDGGGRPVVFAQIYRRMKGGTLCQIVSAGKWTTKANVMNTVDGIRPGGWYKGDAEVYWNIKSLDDQHYQEIVGALAEICRVR